MEVANSRSRRRYQATERRESDDNEEANGDGGKESSSTDDHSAEVKPKRKKRLARAPLAAANLDRGGDENDAVVDKGSHGASLGFIDPSERLSWGKVGMRRHTRHGSANSTNGKNAQNSGFLSL